MPLLLWRAIEDAKRQGASDFDFGRSDLDNPGLIAFKDHWGTSRLTLKYVRFPGVYHQYGESEFRKAITRYTFTRMSDRLLSTMGALLYKHAG